MDAEVPLMFRVRLFRPDGTPLGELSDDAGTLLSCERSEEINAEHSLSITTERHLEVGTRALTRHADGRWREWVVDEPAETHDSGLHAKGTYHLCWSLQYDLQAVYGRTREVGMVNPAPASAALVAALDGTTRWQAGATDVTTTALGVVMEEKDSSWDRLNVIAKRWGGEFDAEITVNDFGVTSRKVILRQHLGSQVPTRRFEWGHNLTSITRTPDPGPYFCRIVPLGNGESEEASDGVTTYNVYLDISSCKYYYDSGNGIRHDRGSRYLRDEQSELLFRVSDGKGGYEYPHAVVTFPTDDADELFELARQDMLSHTRPGISYSGSVASFAGAGMDTDGIELGEEVQAIDLGFNADLPLRVQERVLKMDVDELGKDDTKISIGRLSPTLERNLATITKTIGAADISYNTPTWDSSKYPVTTPTLPIYEVEQPDSGGYTYTVPTYNTDIPDYSSALSDLYDRVGAIDGGYVGGYSGGGGEAAANDGIIHQFDGVTMTEGTINFSTTYQGESDTQTTPSDWGTKMHHKEDRVERKKSGDASYWGSGGGDF